ncbi:MAG TPA: SDR family NAD(P)-dependent oxidoreductase [Nostocaceae cyanobacterium]|nr:SDR family NAD(P)-dependent oxidoreductase [Nostocaceae cyanobacterium]
MHKSNESLSNFSEYKESSINKNVLITGGTGGIGSALVTQFAHAGYTVWFTYFQGKETAQQLLESLSPRNVQAFQLDLSDWVSLQNLLQTLPEPVDILINNAALGSGTVKKRFAQPYLQDQALLQVNAVGSLWLTQEILPMMRKRKYGKIIFISSVGGGITQFPGFRLADSMSKAAITFLSKQLAAELSHEPIDVFSICPGATNTPMLEASLLNGLSIDEKELLYNSLPSSRLVEPDEVADLALYLVTEKAKILRGAVIDASLGLGVNPGTLTSFMQNINQASINNTHAKASNITSI